MPTPNHPYRTSFPATTLYVRPGSSEKWSGLLPEANGHDSDGPLPTLAVALEKLRLAPPVAPVTIVLSAGTHFLNEPLLLTSDTPLVTITAAPGSTATLSGGRRITTFTESIQNGRRTWTTTLPEVASGNWYFRSLFVNNAPAPRPRLPKKGIHRIASVPGMTFDGFIGPPEAHHTTFFCEPGQLAAWKNLTDIDAVAVHYWMEERLPLAAIDPASGRVDTQVKPFFPLKDDAAARCARFWFENVAEALTESGEWYLDRPTGTLTYLPRDNEQLATTEIIAPVLSHLLRLEGTPDHPVRGIILKGLTFAHVDWHHIEGRGTDSQAAYSVPAMIQLTHARQCALEHCTIGPAGPYGVHIGPGCRGNRIAHCTFTGLGAGGLKIMPEPTLDRDVPTPTEADRVSHNLIEHNEIAHSTYVFPSAVGILIIHADHNIIRHNHIHHLEYSGISCGWTWGFGDSATHHNQLLDNHIHHVGSALLNDMGGIYTLGEQPGTVIAYNHIHDVRAENYGGWAIYLDEGSSYILVENNLLHHTSSECLNLHYGRENIIRNNVLAFSGLGVISISAAGADYNSFTLERNIILTDGKPVLVARDTDTLAQRGFRSDLNLYWDHQGKDIYAGDEYRDAMSLVTWKRYTLAELQKLGYDPHSLSANPLFTDPANDDFTLAANSPALALGFTPFTAAGAKAG